MICEGSWPILMIGVKVKLFSSKFQSTNAAAAESKFRLWIETISLVSCEVQWVNKKGSDVCQKCLEDRHWIELEEKLQIPSMTFSTRPFWWPQMLLLFYCNHHIMPQCSIILLFNICFASSLVEAFTTLFFQQHSVSRLDKRLNKSFAHAEFVNEKFAFSKEADDEFLGAAAAAAKPCLNLDTISIVCLLHKVSKKAACERFTNVEICMPAFLVT